MVAAVGGGTNQVDALVPGVDAETYRTAAAKPAARSAGMCVI